MSIESTIVSLRNELAEKKCKLLAVSKHQSIERIREAYEAGQRAFGENKVKELVEKWEALPQNIEWHMIGHLQTNKVKYIAPFISLIHSLDSQKLLHEINKQGQKINRVVPCLLQIRIAQEESKFGLPQQEAVAIFDAIGDYPFVGIKGVMGMATFTQDEDQVRKEFDQLRQVYTLLKNKKPPQSVIFNELSMGMSSDYTMALEMGSTMVRIGTSIFKQ